MLNRRIGARLLRHQCARLTYISTSRRLPCQRSLRNTCIVGTGDHDFRGFRQDDPTLGGFEPGNQAQFSLRTTNGIPRKPKAVGIPQVRFAAMLLELFRKEYVLPLRFHFGRVLVGIKGVDRQRPLDTHGLFLVFAEEVESAAQAAHPHLARLVHDRVRPHGRHARRSLGLIAKWPKGRDVNIELLTTGEGGRRDQQHRCYDDRAQSSIHQCSNSELVMRSFIGQHQRIQGDSGAAPAAGNRATGATFSEGADGGGT